MIKELKKEVETLQSTSTLLWILKEIQNQQDDYIAIVCKVSEFFFLHLFSSLESLYLKIVPSFKILCFVFNNKLFRIMKYVEFQYCSWLLYHLTLQVSLEPNLI